MDVLTLRTELETVLVNYLGDYTLANGAKTPAISVRAAGESLPLWVKKLTTQGSQPVANESSNKGPRPDTQCIVI